MKFSQFLRTILVLVFDLFNLIFLVLNSYYCSQIRRPIEIEISIKTWPVYIFHAPFRAHSVQTTNCCVSSLQQPASMKCLRALSLCFSSFFIRKLGFPASYSSSAAFSLSFDVRCVGKKFLSAFSALSFCPISLSPKMQQLFWPASFLFLPLLLLLVFSCIVM